MTGSRCGGRATRDGVLEALAWVRGRLRCDLWELFRRTGTTHLMSISGLHVSMVSGWSSSWSPGCGARRPARHAPAGAARRRLGAVAAALGYSALARFSVPTQRSLLMARSPRRGVAAARAASVAGARGRAPRVLVLDPLAVLAVDFWLSFAPSP